MPPNISAVLTSEVVPPNISAVQTSEVVPPNISAVQTSEIVPPLNSACNYVHPNTVNTVQSILKISTLPMYTENQYREVLTNAQLRAKITAFRISKQVPCLYSRI